MNPYKLTSKLDNGTPLTGEEAKYLIDLVERLTDIEVEYTKELKIADDRWKTNEQYRERYMQAYTEGVLEGKAECAKEKEDALTSQRQTLREEIQKIFSNKLEGYVKEGDTPGADTLVDLKADVLSLLDNN